MIPADIIFFERVMGWLVEDGKLPLLSTRTCLACKTTMKLRESRLHKCRYAETGK